MCFNVKTRMQITEKQNELYQGNMEILKNPLNA